MNPPARYKAALAALLLSVPLVGRAERVAGVSLPDEAKVVGENRFQVEKSYEDTLKFFKAVYPPARFHRRAIANLPGVKAVHIENPDPRPGGWDGLNVYELKGATRIYVLVAPAEEKGKKQRKK